MELMDRIACLDKEFAPLKNREERYQKLIELGRGLPSLSTQSKIDENLVAGCQSRMYLISYEKDGRLFFESEADALISQGLAALLIRVYSGLSPETVLHQPPTFLQKWDIPASLTPSRVNGLSSLYRKMQQKALAMILRHQSSSSQEGGF